ncbi:MAG: TetR family transcriptional regulator [Rhodobacter sp. CACIA14H1]|nr:MAG: TetR family transcriptional regulator [Rhodobacter sp. CACIA14H1]
MDLPSTTPARPPLQHRSKQRVDRILDAARELIAIRGCAALTMRDLAQESGMTPASIYRYFPNRAAVLERLGEDYARLFIDRLLAALEDRSLTREGFVVRFRTLIDEFYALHLRDPVLRDIWQGVLVDKALSGIARRTRDTGVRLLMDVVAPLFPDVRPAELKLDMLLLLELATTATSAALDLPASDARRVVDRGKGWIAPLVHDYLP